MKIHKIIPLAVLAFLITVTSCQKFDELEANPNLAGEEAIVPPSYLLGRILFELYQGAGFTDNVSGRVFEGPWNQLSRWSQFTVSNDSYYGGDNVYGWSNTATPYNLLKLTNKMELQAAKALNPERNAYKTLGKFFRAYTYVWLTQRVGDIPTDEAGLGLENLTPQYTSQKDVYAKALQLLEDANTDLNTLIPTITPATNIGGDIYFNNDLKKWQKVINTFKLRVLISLSKRAEDTPALGIKQKFADVVADPVKYPLLTGNSDNLQFVYNEAFNPYPITPRDFYNRNTNISSTFLELLTATKDPRTFVLTTPAPALIKGGKSASDFDAYKGSNISKTLTALASEKASDVANSPYSYISYLRYYKSYVGPEPYIIMGYPEMCFNMAEAANRGWITGDAAAYYLKGINASLGFYGISDGAKVEVSDAGGSKAATVAVTVSVTDFLTNVAYKGNNADGLKQILDQKYVAFFQNSGWEAFYNWRRTGFPSTFVTTGSGINAQGKIPMRWRYPVDETTYNAAHAKVAIDNQYGGNDDIYALMWLLK
ncbi:MAG: SusD/RagB family nutrient-binding outer membrane lipoprotein [Bacteroidota bacterium]